MARPLVEIKERLNLACGSAPQIIRAFDNQLGNVEWKDGDRQDMQFIAEKISSKVGADTAYQNAMNNSKISASSMTKPYSG